MTDVNKSKEQDQVDANTKKSGDGIGVEVSSKTLKQMKEENVAEVLEKLGEGNPELAEKIRRAMFSFEDLISAEPRGFQHLLRGVTHETLVLALKLASKKLREKVFNCVSPRAVAMLREELELKGPVRVSLIKQAQQEIVDLAIQMISEGRLYVQGHGEQMV
ncbi:MAG: FliG C-terminal domain-containing protein [Pseudomonadota bacterium]